MLVEAGLISVFRTILVIVLVYYIVKYILRFFMPFLFKYILKKQATAFNTRTKNNESHKKEGEVHIKTKSTSKSRNDTLGDYVEYEEVEDSKS